MFWSLIIGTGFGGVLGQIRCRRPPKAKKPPEVDDTFILSQQPRKLCEKWETAIFSIDGIVSKGYSDNINFVDLMSFFRGLYYL